jgi:hypothetical protein
LTDGAVWGGDTLGRHDVSGCGSSSPSIYNSWIYVNGGGTAGFALDFKQNGTYVSQTLELTSSTSADVQLETGTFAISGSTITFTPQDWSCADLNDPPYSATYTLTDSSLEVAGPTGLTVLHVDSSAGTNNFTEVIGCFTAGVFTESTLGCGGATCSAATGCCAGFSCVATTAGSPAGTCAANCTTNSQCASGCCAPLSDNAGACQALTACK